MAGFGQLDEEAPRPRRRLEPLALYPLGVEEMEGYIAELRAEIARVEEEIGRKRKHRDAADAFFRPA